MRGTRATRKGVELALETDGVGAVEADERKVKQVVFNLLTNAVKFTPAGGKITVSARRSGPRPSCASRYTRPGRLRLSSSMSV